MHAMRVHKNEQAALVRRQFFTRHRGGDFHAHRSPSLTTESVRTGCEHRAMSSRLLALSLQQSAPAAKTATKEIISNQKRR
jgi:hypothetical protein